MTFLRNVLHDLIHKKLWPVAIALVAAVIAVPIVLGGSSDAGTPATDLAATAGPKPAADPRAANVVNLEQQAVGKVKRPGGTRDPFVQHHMPKAETTTDAVTDVVKAAKDAIDSLSGGDTAVTSPSSSGGTTPPSAPKKDNDSAKPDSDSSDASDTYHVTLAFGEAGAEKTYNNVARLTPLPSADQPLFVFLGLKSDGTSAVFLVDAEATPSGDGSCEPSAESCEQVVLKEGDVEFLEVQTETAGVVQYRLELKDIKTSTASTKASAARAHTRESRAGREYLRELMADDPSALDAWDFSSQLGLLVAKEPVVANLPVDVAAAAEGQAPVDPTTVLTIPEPAALAPQP